MLMKIDRVILHLCKETRRIFTDITVKGARFFVDCRADETRRSETITLGVRRL